jgi:hypothetical protein
MRKAAEAGTMVVGHMQHGARSAVRSRPWRRLSQTAPLRTCTRLTFSPDSMVWGLLNKIH